MPSSNHQLEQALQRASEPLPLPSMQISDVALFIGLMRQAAYIAELKITEEKDREAIRTQYEIRRREITSELAKVEMAIRNDRYVFELLLRDATDITKMLIERGEVAAALEVQKRVFDVAPSNTLGKVKDMLQYNRVRLIED